MTEKRYKFKKESLNDFDEYGLESPILLGGGVLTFGEVIDKLNEQYIEIQRVYSTLDNRIEKLQEDLEKLKDMDNTEDLNPQAVEDVALVISMYISALKEFKRELIGDVE